MAADIGIAGAGLLGRLLAWTLARAGHRVEVFDPAPGPTPAFDGQGAAAFSAAGMLCPLAEREHAPPEVVALGWRALPRWRALVEQLGAPRPRFSQQGSLLLAHRGDLGSAQRALARIDPPEASAGSPRPQRLTAAELAALEPSLAPVAAAWLLPEEGLIDPLATLAALQARAPGVAWHWSRPVRQVEPGCLHFDDGPRRYATVFDVRGLGARPPAEDGAGAGWPGRLRGVRGETVWLQAPDHGLQRPLRLLHPRHRVYLVPRGPDGLLLGATEIESEDRSPVSLKSAVELMSAAHSVMPGLAEARILRLDRNLRPALPDHRPRIEAEPGRVRINGLFRHGWLMAPALVDDALAAWAGMPEPEEMA